jgi:hypothetical protein
MPLQKILLKPGVNRENTRYTSEGGFYESDKVRFRQGTPEKIGGWVRISENTFQGVCRSLWNWITLSYQNLLGVGTNLKFYIENGGVYNDITPIRVSNTLTNPFQTTIGSNVVKVTDPNGGFENNDFVTFSPTTTLGGVTIFGEYQITYLTNTTYNITASGQAAFALVGGGTINAVYQINTGAEYAIPAVGWGAGPWGGGTWGNGLASATAIRIWNQNNFGQDLILGPRDAPLYYWNANIGYTAKTAAISIASPCVVSFSGSLLNGTALTLQTTGALPTGLTIGVTYYVINSTGGTFNLAATPGGVAINTSGTQSGIQAISPRAIPISELAGANETPISQIYFLVSDTSRFVMCFGTNDIYGTTIDPMLIRWSDQESVTEWEPAITNQAGSTRLSHGSTIVTALQSRQEILVWTDAALYSLQYLGPPYVWGTQLLASNISIAGPNAAAVASGVVYWMGADKFYKYAGGIQTLRCDLLRYVYNDINRQQFNQVYAGTNEGFNEVWWFYCSEHEEDGTTPNNVVDRYVVYNYVEDVWYYGNLGRTAWLDTGLRNFPVAATYAHNLVDHETGVDDGMLADLLPIEASITTSQFDIQDGHNFAFIYRILPDLTFNGSTDGVTPRLTMQLLPLKNSGSGYTSPKSVGGTDTDAEQPVVATQSYPIDLDTYDGQIYIRVRGRQMAMRITSDTIGTQWQLGAPRIDIRPDGRR